MKSLKVNGKDSFIDFGQCIASREIAIPEKRIIKETVPFKNGSYDFTSINGEPTFENRTVTYTFDIIGASMAEVEEQKRQILDWLTFVENADIYDGYITGYHFKGSFESFEWSEDWEQSELSVTFSVYPYMIADEATIKTVESTKKDGVSVDVENNGSHAVIPSFKADGVIEIKKGNLTLTSGHELFSLAKYKNNISENGKTAVFTTKDGRSVLTQSSNNLDDYWSRVDIIKDFDSNSVYTVSMEVCTKGNFGIYILYTDGTKEYTPFENLAEYEWKYYKITTNPTKTIDRIYTTYHDIVNRTDLQFWIDTGSITAFKSQKMGEFDFSYLKNQIAEKEKEWVGEVKDGRRTITQKSNTIDDIWMRVKVAESFKSNIQYTFSGEVFNLYNFCFVFLYTDGTKTTNPYSSKNPSDTWKKVVVTSDPKKTISSIYLSYQNTNFEPLQYWLDVDSITLEPTDPSNQGIKNPMIVLEKGSNDLEIAATGEVDIIFHEEVF